MINPLNRDPTRTITLRRSFGTSINRVFGDLRREIEALIIGEDAFGLVTNTRWKYRTQTEAVEEFDKWLKQQIQDKVLSSREANRWKNYIQKGFEKGTARAFDQVDKKTKRSALDSIRGEGFIEGKREQFIRSSINKVTAIEKLTALQQRTFSDIIGMTEDMRTKMKRTLIDSLTRREQPKQIASRLSKVLKISKNRARSIVNTELVRAHAEGQLEAMEQLGIAEVGVAVEWDALDSACKFCKPMDNVVLKVSEARGLIPRHPGCRCAWIPANIGEDKEEKRQQKRSKSKIDRAIRQSQKREGSKEWKPNKSISKVRPTNPIFNCECSQHMIDFESLIREVDMTPKENYLSHVYVEEFLHNNELTGGEWKTIKGQHVYIKDGTITVGLEELKGKKIEDIRQNSFKLKDGRRAEINIEKTSEQEERVTYSIKVDVGDKTAATAEVYVFLGGKDNFANVHPSVKSEYRKQGIAENIYLRVASMVGKKHNAYLEASDDMTDSAVLFWERLEEKGISKRFRIDKRRN